MKVFTALVKRLFHCALRLHCSETVTIEGKIVLVACRCNRVFYVDPLINRKQLFESWMWARSEYEFQKEEKENGSSI